MRIRFTASAEADLEKIGDRIRRPVLTETKQPPLYVVRDTVGIESELAR